MKKIIALLIFILIQNASRATSINPLDDSGWELDAHMSNTGGMFDGNGELRPNYSFGIFDAFANSCKG